MKVEEWEVGRIVPYENNPRLNEDAVEKVAASIKEFGFRQPIVVDEKGTIIVGHTRYKAALELGLKTVPVHVAAGLTPEQAAAYRLADNKTAEFAFWDSDALGIELDALGSSGFDMEPFGFDADASADPVNAFMENDVTKDDEDGEVAGEDENYLLRIRVPKKHKAAVEKYRKANGDSSFTSAVLAVVGIKEG